MSKFKQFIAESKVSKEDMDGLREMVSDYKDLMKSGDKKGAKELKGVIDTEAKKLGIKSRGLF